MIKHASLIDSMYIVPLFQDLLEEVETVFQSSSCLNGSLLRSSHPFCGTKNSGIDLNAWREAYDAIEQCPKDTLKVSFQQFLTL